MVMSFCLAASDFFRPKKAYFSFYIQHIFYENDMTDTFPFQKFKKYNLH